MGTSSSNFKFTGNPQLTPYQPRGLEYFTYVPQLKAKIKGAAMNKANEMYMNTTGVAPQDLENAMDMKSMIDVQRSKAVESIMGGDTSTDRIVQDLVKMSSNVNERSQTMNAMLDNSAKRTKWRDRMDRVGDATGDYVYSENSKTYADRDWGGTMGADGTIQEFKEYAPPRRVDIEGDFRKRLEIAEENMSPEQKIAMGDLSFQTIKLKNPAGEGFIHQLVTRTPGGFSGNKSAIDAELAEYNKLLADPNSDEYKYLEHQGGEFASAMMTKIAGMETAHYRNDRRPASFSTRFLGTDESLGGTKTSEGNVFRQRQRPFKQAVAPVISKASDQVTMGDHKVVPELDKSRERTGKLVGYKDYVVSMADKERSFLGNFFRINPITGKQNDPEDMLLTKGDLLKMTEAQRKQNIHPDIEYNLALGTYREALDDTDHDLHNEATEFQDIVKKYKKSIDDYNIAEANIDENSEELLGYSLTGTVDEALGSYKSKIDMMINIDQSGYEPSPTLAAKYELTEALQEFYNHGVSVSTPFLQLNEFDFSIDSKNPAKVKTTHDMWNETYKQDVLNSVDEMDIVLLDLPISDDGAMFDLLTTSKDKTSAGTAMRSMAIEAITNSGKTSSLPTSISMTSRPSDYINRDWTPETKAAFDEKFKNALFFPLGSEVSRDVTFAALKNTTQYIMIQNNNPDLRQREIRAVTMSAEGVNESESNTVNKSIMQMPSNKEVVIQPVFNNEENIPTLSNQIFTIIDRGGFIEMQLHYMENGEKVYMGTEYAHNRQEAVTWTREMMNQKL